MKRHAWLLCLAVTPVLAQADRGAIRVRVLDPSKRPVPTAVLQLDSAGLGFHEQLPTDAAGLVTYRLLPFGPYTVTLRAPGFAAQAYSLNVHSTLPVEITSTLSLDVATTIVNVESQTLIDEQTSTSPQQIGRGEIATRLSSLPGRSLQDLINTQPGWLYEGNAVLHPRGSEYQTQIVLDGLPLLDNRSPGFGPEIEAETAESLQIYTAGFPAEYGRKLGGVVEVTTQRQHDPGWHGDFALLGGSYQTASYFARVVDTKGKSSFAGTAANSTTSHFLNPVVPQNFTNKGSDGDYSIAFDRDLSSRDHIGVSLRHAFSGFEVPNELLQQEAGQLQHGRNQETLGTFRFQHLFSIRAVLNLTGMVRDDGNGLDSNNASTPILAKQRNAFQEGYGKAALGWAVSHQEWKAGLESDTTILHEDFQDLITDPTQFDDGTAPSFRFTASRPDLEQAAFVQDQISLGPWTISAGLRWDLYQLLLHRQALSPRLSMARALQRSGTVLHVAYDRIFQTPSSENILLSGSPLLAALNPDILRLPVQPSVGNYYELGLTQEFRSHIRLDATAYRRNVNHFADDDQLLNTGISYPIAFNEAKIYGAEGKVALRPWRHLSGFASYSYMVGQATFPVTGGLFLGDDVQQALAQLQGHFPISQDQRNTVRTRMFLQANRHLSVASGLTYGSGLPFEFGGTEAEALATEGAAVVRRVNFDRGRVRPNLALSASVMADLYKTDQLAIHLQVDGDNLNNRLNVLDFGGLFSGNAIAPNRSIALKLSVAF